MPRSGTFYRTCNLCEAMCGVAITLEEEQIIAIKGDENDPFSRGHICPKALALKDLYEDPDRLRKPMEKRDGQRHELALHMAMGGTYQQADVTQVVIRKNDNNQYKVNGSINGQPVHFLVDTGANTVAMNEIQARNLGLLYKMDGQESRAVTASGVVSTWVVTLNAVKVGEINVPNVRAVVIEGAYPQEVLLGMSYLEYVKIQEHNSVLMLEKNF